MLHYLIKDNRLVRSDSEDLQLFSDPKTFSVAAPDELRAIADISQVHEYTIRECFNGNLHARLDCHPDYSYGPLSSMDIKDERVMPVDFRFYLTAHSLLLVTQGNNPLVHKFVEDLSDEVFLQKYDTITPQTLIIALMEQIILRNESFADDVEDGIEELEERVLAEAKREYSKQIVGKRRLVMRMKHHMEPLLYVIQSFTDNENKLFSTTEIKAIRILAKKAEGMVANILMLKDYATHVREAYQAEHDIKSNDIMRVFTVVTSTFLPPTLIVGWYGMNFENMPELGWHWGYAYVALLNLAVVAGSIYLIRTKRWV